MFSKLLSLWTQEGRGSRSLLVLFLGMICIVAWQFTLAPHAEKSDAQYRVTASTGINQEQRAFFFMYHLGIFPLMTRAVIRDDNRAEAERQLREHPTDLIMDDGSTFRSGDRGRTYLYWVDGILRHRGLLASLVPAHALAFVLSLWALWWGCWWQRRPLLGAMLTAVLGSNPWQLFAVYAQENVFSWSITTMILLLGLCMPLLGKQSPPRWYPWFLAVFTGLAMASIRTIRSEPTALLGGVVIVFLSFTGVRWWKRLALIAVMLVMFSGLSKHYERTFVRGVENTNAVMRRIGGAAYTGPVQPFHEVWHALFCGLGDFDHTYGYVWDDRVAFRYAYPFLLRQHGSRYAWHTEINYFSTTYDPTGKYPIFWSEVPGYHDVIKNKVLGDIRRDRKWFAWIIVQRIGATLLETTPVTIAVGEKHKELKGYWVGSLAFLIFLYTVARKQWFWAKMILIAAPLSANSIIVYSGGGMCNYSCYHLIAIPLLAYGAMMLAASVLWKHWGKVR